VSEILIPSKLKYLTVSITFSVDDGGRRFRIPPLTIFAKIDINDKNRLKFYSAKFFSDRLTTVVGLLRALMDGYLERGAHCVFPC